MIESSSLRRFVTVSREFDFVIATKVAYSRVRGRLFPGLALPDPPAHNATLREVSVLLITSEHGAATVDAIVEILAGRLRLDWEVCICERASVAPDMARVLARLRGTQPWIRIVRADESVDDTIAAQWTVEQATGKIVALVGPGYTPDADAFARLLDRLRTDSGLDAAALSGTDSGSRSPIWQSPWTECRLLLQKKSAYLATVQGQWPLTASALAKVLDGTDRPVAYLVAEESEVLD